MDNFKKALLSVITFTVFCGFIYTMVMTGICQVLFPNSANGKIIEVNGVKYGSELLGQQYTSDRYMWGRITKIDVSTYKDDEENGQKLDRGDKFIYRINDFYENKSMEHIIFSNTHGRKSKTATAEENTQKLKNVLLTFLDKLNDVNGYCKYMYLIDDKKYIRKLVEEGQKPIVTGCDVVRYMKLAEEYWMIKYNKINEMM